MDRTIMVYIFNIACILGLVAYSRASFKKPKAIPQVRIIKGIFFRCYLKTRASIAWFAETGNQKEHIIALSVRLVS